MTHPTRTIRTFALTAILLSAAGTATASEFEFELSSGRVVYGEPIEGPNRDCVYVLLRGSVSRVVCCYRADEIKDRRPLIRSIPSPDRHGPSFAELANIALFGKTVNSQSSAQKAVTTAEGPRSGPAN